MLSETKATSVLNPRQEIVAGLRGRFLVPVISALAELEMLPQMMKCRFQPDDFQGTANTDVLESLFQYLESVGLLQSDDALQTFTVTELGAKLFARAGAFLLLESYQEYFDRLPELLTQPNAVATCDRRMNVLGSGSLHRKKFFPAAFALLDELSPDTIVDVGCGDGTFLSLALDRYVGSHGVGVDLSPIAVNETRLRLVRHSADFVITDASRTDQWCEVIPPSTRPVVVMWFVLHEFAQGRTDVAVEFFRRLRQELPHAHVLLGEVVSLSPADLSAARLNSVMPEFSLFHALSGQGLLTWTQFARLRDLIPYDVVSEKHFDAIATEVGSVPSSLIWHLKPKSQ